MNHSPTKYVLLGFGALLLLILGIFAIQLMSPDNSDEISLIEHSEMEDSESVEEPSFSEDRSNEMAVLTKSDLDLHPQLQDLKYDATIRGIAKLEDPVVDGWDTERFSEQADSQFKQLGKLLANRRMIDASHVASFSVPEFRGRLRPGTLSSVFSDSSVGVLRGAVSTSQECVAALSDLANVFAKTTASRSKFKIIRVELDGSTAKTVSYFQMVGWSDKPWQQDLVGSVQRVQVNATWDCVWDLEDSESPKLQGVTVSDYEEVYSKGSKLFVDATQSQFKGIDALSRQLIYGRDHWYANLESSIGVEGRGNGLAIGDANGDGLEDIYICQPAALPNKLLLRNPDGSFTDKSAYAGVDWLDSSRGALFVDMDNDGDQDLIVSISSDIILHENDGEGRFALRHAIRTNSRLFSINAIDFDNDGRLDLYACGYSGANQIRPEDIFASPVPYHDANNGAANVLLRQTSPWTFADVTKDVGLDQKNLRFSLASTWDDMDLDGDLDLYVANDFGKNNLYRNDNGKFVDIAAEAGVEDIGPGMSCAWGDYNNDGSCDLYVSNMFSSAGSRITHNSQFKPDASQDDLVGFQRHARGNTLFANNGNGTFTDRAIESGTTMGRWAWGSLFVDINNDGLRDVYVTNGFVTADNNNDL